MKVNANSLRVGHVLEYQNKLWAVLKTNVIKPGKGGAFIQVEMKQLRGGVKTVERFRTQEDVERAYLDSRPLQFLYAQQEEYVFMDTETFDQVAIDQEVIGEAKNFLQEGMVCTAHFHKEIVVILDLPSAVTLEVTQTEPVTKNQTATSSYKPAVLENGVRVMVPPYIGVGMKVVINPLDQTYLERDKSA